VIRQPVLIAAVAIVAAGAPRPLAAQDADRAPKAATIDIYRFVLGVDVPESPALTTLGAAANPIPLGGAPKPLDAQAVLTFGPGEDVVLAGAVDFTPYFAFSSGKRTLESYRSNSIGGRLLRVLTKTQLSVGAARLSDDPSSVTMALAIRSTFHDPHDPIANSTLPEDVALAGSEEERAALYADARRAMRGRSGDAQISGGWGVMERARSGVVEPDSLVDARHTLWVSAQYTASYLFDIVGSLQYRDAFGSDDRLWIGGALRRKSDDADLQLGLYYDTGRSELNPGISLDARLGRTLGVIAAVTTQSTPMSFTGPRRAHISLSGRWFYASDPMGH